MRTIELSRELIRRGADVYAVTTPAAERIIHPDALHYATGNEVIRDITGKVEHVQFCGMNGCADLLVIAPATANTISKIAAGIDDTPVTTFATTAIGSGISVMLVPAMHESMYCHPAIVDNLDKLRLWGVTIIGPQMEEGIAKIVSNEMIVLNAERILGPDTLSGKRILITSGTTAEFLDPIRILTTFASGKTGIEIALEAFRRGADVTIVHMNRLGFEGIKEILVQTSQQMTDAVMEELDREEYDMLISAAAISDFTVDMSPEKIKSADNIIIKMKPAVKLIDRVRQSFPDLAIAGFKAETGLSAEQLLSRAWDRMDQSKLDLIVANDVLERGMGTEDNEVYIMSDKRDVKKVSGLKRTIASSLLDEVEKCFQQRDDLSEGN